MSAPSSPPFPGVPERIADIIFALCQTLTTRLRTPTLTQAQLTYIVGRLLGIRTRFQRLVARIRAGRAPRERARAARAPTPAPECPAEFPLGFRPPPPGWRRWAVRADKPVPTWRSLRQTSFAWLLPLAPNVPEFRDSAVLHRALLLDLLAEPQTRALLLASRRVGDSLRPLCWMLGIELSLLYPARPAADAAGTTAPSADDRGLDPVTAEFFPRVAGTQIVAAMEPAMRGVIAPPAERPQAREGGDFSATA